MGPGLVFILALAGVLPLNAEESVGLEAQGVDPLAALQNPGGLDVRDELGRPVSAQRVSADLKKAQTKAVVQAAYSSSLPQAAAVVALLEMLEALRLALRPGAAGNVPPRLYALIRAARSAQKPPVAALLIGFALLTAAWCRRSTSCPLSCRSAAPIVLRC